MNSNGNGGDFNDPPFFRDHIAGGDKPNGHTHGDASGHTHDVRPPLRIRDFDEIDFDLDAETWLIEDLLLTEEISLIHGPTNAGKTFLALDLNLTVAAGGEWFGHKVTPGRVVYLAAEGGRRIDKRIAAWKQDRGYLRKGESCLSR